jgi:pimeloyl-ACP methyl ester carboxylesterase
LRDYQQHMLTMDDGARISVFESGEVGAQQVLLAHAAGFHARCWDRVVELLPPNWHVLAVDIRGHGRSDKQPPYMWSRFAADLLSVARHFQLSSAIGVGHSLGGHCVTHVCALAPQLFDRLGQAAGIEDHAGIFFNCPQPLFEPVEVGVDDSFDV